MQDQRYFTDQRDPRLAAPGSNLGSGAATTGINTDLEPGAQYRPTREMQAIPVGDTETAQTLAVPKLKEGATESSLTEIMGHEPGQPIQKIDEGFGPRLVILQHFVTGPGIKAGDPRPAFGRGKVIWASQLIGDEHMKKAQEGDAESIAMLRRYVSGLNPAAREARPDEAMYSQVTFIEGERAMGAALQKTQAYVAGIETENDRFRRIMENLGLDPNMSPEQAASSRVISASEPTAQGPAESPGVTAPTATPVAPPVAPVVAPVVTQAKKPETEF